VDDADRMVAVVDDPADLRSLVELDTGEETCPGRRAARVMDNGSAPARISALARTLRRQGPLPAHASLYHDLDGTVLTGPFSDWHARTLGSPPDSEVVEPRVLTTFRTGGGVPFDAYGKDIRDGIERVNRPMFVHQLVQEWIPALPDIDMLLRRADPPGRVADLGCGSGWSTIALAHGYPKARIDGIDLDEASDCAAQCGRGRRRRPSELRPS
jgi:hypothetical protein